MGDDAAFRKALRAAIEAAGFSQAAFGEAVAREEGRPDPYHQTVVADWLSGQYRPSMEAVFAAERVLHMAPGALSRTLGYLPAYAVEPADVASAIAADPSLTEGARSMLTAAYAAAVESLEASQPSRRGKRASAS